MYLHYRWEGETVAAPRADYDRLMSAGGLMGTLDDNQDGKLQAAELRGVQGARYRTQIAMLDRDGDGALNPAELAAATPAGRGVPAAGRGQAATPEAPAATAAPRPVAAN